MYIPLFIVLLIASPFLLMATIVILSKRESTLNFSLIHLIVFIVYMTYLIKLHHPKDDMAGAEKMFLPAIFISVQILIGFLHALYLPKKRNRK